MNQALSSHNLNEYAQIAVFASGGASLGFQLFIRRLSPSKAVNIFSRIITAMPGACSPQKQANFSQKLADSVTWLKSKEDLIVMGSGVITATAKACIDSRESQLSAIAQDDKNRTLSAEITGLKTALKDYRNELDLMSSQFHSLSHKLIQKEDENALLKMDLAKALKKASISSTKQME